MDAYGEVGADVQNQSEEHCDQHLSDGDDDDADLRLAFALMNTSAPQSAELNGDSPEGEVVVEDPYVTPPPKKTSSRSPLGAANSKKDLASWLDQTFTW